MSIDAVLREPAHQVSPRAVGYWRLGAGLLLAFWIVLALVWVVALPHPWWSVADRGASSSVRRRRTSW